MKKIVIIGFCIMLLSGCNIFKSDMPDAGERVRITNFDADIFEKNKECYSYKDEIESQRKKIGAEQNTLEEDGYIEAMFYSPKVNSCVYIFTIYEFPYYKKELTNIFTNDIYVSFDINVEDDAKMNKEWKETFNKTVSLYQQVE